MVFGLGLLGELEAEGGEVVGVFFEEGGEAVGGGGVEVFGGGFLPVGGFAEGLGEGLEVGGEGGFEFVDGSGVGGDGVVDGGADGEVLDDAEEGIVAVFFDEVGDDLAGLVVGEHEVVG